MFMSMIQMTTSEEYTRFIPEGSLKIVVIYKKKTFCFSISFQVELAEARELMAHVIRA